MGFGIALYLQNLTPKYSTTLRKSLILSVLIPSGVQQNFRFFSHFGEYLRVAHLPVEVFDSARSMQGPAEHFINQKQRGNCSRIWLCNGSLHTKTSSTVMQDLLISLVTPYALAQPHPSMGEPPCTWKASSVEWHGTFSQWDLSIRQVVSQNMFHMCARLRRLRYYTSECSSEGNPCRKSKVRNHTQNTPIRLKEPWKRLFVL